MPKTLHNHYLKYILHLNVTLDFKHTKQNFSHLYVHSIHLTPPIFHLSAAPNSATEGLEQSMYPPLVLAAISAANILLLLISLSAFIASCAVLCRARRGRQQDTIHNYEAANDEVKGHMVTAESDAVSIHADTVDLHLPVQLQYQTLQTHTMQNHQYATVTRPHAS